MDDLSSLTYDIVSHDALTETQLRGLQTLFDAEYLEDFGAWNPDLPYGYAGHDVHALATRPDGRIAAHAGWGRRQIAVGGRDISVAGVGGVLVARASRGEGLGARIMAHALRSMKDAGGIQFGYLGCRDEVATFYSACGWRRVVARERFLDRHGIARDEPPGAPLMIHPVEAALEEWPDGGIDLRGRSW